MMPWRQPRLRVEPALLLGHEGWCLSPTARLLDQQRHIELADLIQINTYWLDRAMVRSRSAIHSKGIVAKSSVPGWLHSHSVLRGRCKGRGESLPWLRQAITSSRMQQRGEVKCLR